MNEDLIVDMINRYYYVLREAKSIPMTDASWDVTICIENVAALEYLTGH